MPEPKKLYSLNIPSKSYPSIYCKDIKIVKVIRLKKNDIFVNYLELFLPSFQILAKKLGIFPSVRARVSVIKFNLVIK
jgi:hypothetical protein